MSRWTKYKAAEATNLERSHPGFLNVRLPFGNVISLLKICITEGKRAKNKLRSLRSVMNLQRCYLSVFMWRFGVQGDGSQALRYGMIK